MTGGSLLGPEVQAGRRRFSVAPLSIASCLKPDGLWQNRGHVLRSSSCDCAFVFETLEHHSERVRGMLPLILSIKGTRRSVLVESHARTADQFPVPWQSLSMYVARAARLNFPAQELSQKNPGHRICRQRTHAQPFRPQEPEPLTITPTTYCHMRASFYR
jgi:hypothetical protein